MLLGKRLAPWSLALGLLLTIGCADQNRQVSALRAENAQLREKNRGLTVQLAAATQIGTRACAEIETLKGGMNQYVTDAGAAREHDAAVQKLNQLTQQMQAQGTANTPTTAKDRGTNPRIAANNASRRTTRPNNPASITHNNTTNPGVTKQNATTKTSSGKVRGKTVTPPPKPETVKPTQPNPTHGTTPTTAVKPSGHSKT
jgi:hypothetical protein